MKKLTESEFIKRLEDLDSGITTKDTYKNNATSMLFHHEICGCDFIARPMEVFKLKDKKCPKCCKYRKLLDVDIQEYLDKKHGNDNYTVIGRVSTDIIKCSHKCGEIFETRLDLLKKAVIPCPKCSNRQHRMTNDEFIKRVNDLVGDEYVFLEKYTKSSEKIKVRHKCGYEYCVSPNKFLLGRRCPKCSGLLKKTLPEVKKIIKDIDDTYEVVATEYINNETPLEIKHNIPECNKVFKMRFRDFTKENGNRCPFCNASHGEKSIEKYLNIHNISILETQKSFKETGNLRFDFFIEFNSKSFLLEYDGEFHYKPIMGNEEFNKQRKNDLKKEEFCKKNNITLIRIPYWYYKQLESVLDRIFSKDIPDIVMSIDIPINTKIKY